MDQENFDVQQENEVESCQEEVLETVVEQPKKDDKGMKPWQMVLAIVGSVIVLAALAVLLLYGMGFEIVPKGETTPPAAGTQTTPTTAPQTTPTEEVPPYNAKNDYTGTEDTVKQEAGTVVATMGDKQLTNDSLQIYLGLVVRDFCNNYYSYFSEIGFDYTKPLNEQECTFESGCSWEEYFVNAAIETWSNYQAVALLAEEASFELPADVQETLEKMPQQLEDEAKESGFKSAEEMMREYMQCSVAAYQEYYKLYQIGTNFTGKIPTRDELEKCYEDNKDYFDAIGLTKDSGPIVDVRHILIVPEGGTVDTTTGTTTYTDAEWKVCQEKAEEILKTWKNGEATEASFAALANEKSQDPGSNTTGGLYQEITKDSPYVEPFLNWCIDTDNKPGATGIVQTEYGCHIMYMVATSDSWEYEVTLYYNNERTAEMMEEGKEKWPIQTDMSKICLQEIKLV